MSNSTAFRCDIKPGGTWANVTGDVYTSETVKIKRGRPDEATSLTAATLDMALNNRGGVFTPGNPSGTYYPNLTRATPVRVGMGVPPNGGGTDFATAVTSLPDPVIAAETAGYLVACWAQSGATPFLPTFTFPAGYSGSVSINGNFCKAGSSALAVTAGSVGGAALTSSVSAVGAAVSVFVPGGSAAANVGSGGAFGPAGTALSQYVSASSGSVSFSAGDTLIAFITVSDDAGSRLALGPGDDLVGCEWVLIADSGGGPGPRTQAWTRYCAAAGSTVVYCSPTQYDVQDVLLQVWKVTASTQWNARFTGVLSQLATTADLSGADVRCTVQAGSVARQLGAGQPLSYSPMYRFYTAAPRSTIAGGGSPTGLLGYWPMESGASGNGFASPVPGIAPAAPSGSVTLGSDSTVLGSGSLPQVANGGYVTCTLPSGYATGTNVAGQMAGVFKSYNVGYTSTPPLSTFMYAQTTGGDVAYVAVQGNGSATVSLNLYTSAFALVTGSSVASIVIADPSYTDVTKFPAFGVVVSWQPNVSNASNTDVCLTLVGTASGNVADLSTTITGHTIGPVARIVCGRDPTGVEYFTTPLTVGHVYFGTNTATFGAVNPASPENSNVFPCQTARSGLFTAWLGETPAMRMTRICAEARIPFQTGPTVFASTNVACGPQENDTTLNLLQTMALTDGGELAEARGFAGFTYRQLRAMAPQPSALTLDYAAKMITDPFEQYDDDQQVVNDVTATNVDGGTARAFLATGPLGSATIGTYTGSPSVNVQNEARDLPQIAAWYLTQGTTAEPRYKTVTAKLGAIASSTDAVSGLDIGQRFTLVNTPTWVPPAPTELVALGFDETIGETPGTDWTITVNAAPYDPYTVLVPGGGAQETLIDSGSSHLTSTITPTATILSVTTTNVRDVWGTSNPPFDVLIGGERMTVTAISGASSPQTFTVTRSVNGVVKAQTAGTAVDVYFQTNIGLTG